MGFSQSVILYGFAQSIHCYMNYMDRLEAWRWKQCKSQQVGGERPHFREQVCTEGHTHTRGSFIAAFYPSAKLVHHVVNELVYVVLLAEVAGEGQAGEVLQPVPVDGVDVEPDDKRSKQAHVDQQGHGDEDALPVRVEGPESDVGEEGEGEQQAADEAEYVRNVVDPGQEAAHEEEEDDGRQLQEGLPGLLEHLPTLEQLHKQASQEPKLGACWTHLQWQEHHHRHLKEPSTPHQRGPGITLLENSRKIHH